MTMGCLRRRASVILAIAIGLSLASPDRLSGSAMEAAADQGRLPVPLPPKTVAEGRRACEKESEKLWGQKPVRIGGSMRPPKKLRSVAPQYPDLPPETLGSGIWLGEVLIGDSGKVAYVWPIREVIFSPPFPAFNNAITDAIRQWEFAPLLVQGQPMPVCMTVSMTIDWQ